MPPKGFDGADIRVRLQSEIFTGNVIVHCHYLWHHDIGMMSQYEALGKEGDLCAQAERLEPTCYRGAHPGGYTRRASLDRSLRGWGASYALLVGLLLAAAWRGALWARARLSARAGSVAV